ncbi:MAG: cytochrome c biogenesis protein CcsA [Acidimicrobiales bacterium]
MNAALGTGGVVLGVVGSIGAIITLAMGLRADRPELLRMSRTYAFMVLGGALVAFAAMERALITRDFSLRYVAENGSRATPALYNVATLWAALEGSILLWALVLSGYTVAVALKFRRRLSDHLVGWAMLTMFVVTLFFFGLMLGPANPFHTLANVPADGPGPNPLLQNHPLMAFHPPMLYLGYVGFTVPFAFAIAALVTGRLGEGWLVETRRWTLFAWAFLTVGIILGAWWSHEVLGWGGYWAWDPVENASFLPWLTGTAFIHSVMVQERRGMLRVWNLSLLCATFALTILGTFLTRSGVLDSVHAFSGLGHRTAAPRVLRSWIRRGHRGPGGLARRPGCARRRADRLAGLPRGGLPAEQRRLRRLRCSWCCWGRYLAHRRGARRRPRHGGRALLRADDHADRASSRSS